MASTHAGDRNQAGSLLFQLAVKKWAKISAFLCCGLPKLYVSKYPHEFVSAYLGNLLRLSFCHFYFFSFLHPIFSICMCLCSCTGSNLGTASVWTNRADRRKNMPKCDRERGRRCWKQGRTRGRKKKIKQGEARRWGKWRERRGPWPDHTDTLGSLSPCQLCVAVDSERTRSHIHILIYACWRWEHTWPQCSCVCVCVWVCA